MIRDHGAALGWIQATVRGTGATVAYALLPDARGRGVATEALVRLCEWLRLREAVADITAEIDDANLASRRVAAAAGFRATDRRAGSERVWVLSD